MSVTMEDSIKRWTAKRKTALVVEIIQGKTTVASMRRLRPIDFARFRWVTLLREGLRWQMEILHGG